MSDTATRTKPRTAKQITLQLDRLTNRLKTLAEQTMSAANEACALMAEWRLQTTATAPGAGGSNGGAR